MDEIVLCASSAEIVLEQAAIGKGYKLEPTSRQELPHPISLIGASEAGWSAQIDGVVFSHLELLVGKHNDLRRCNNITFHQWNGSIPQYGILRIAEPHTSGLYVTSGAFMALIAARKLPLAALAQYVMYLCGCYCMHQKTPLEPRDAFTDKEKIAQMLRLARGIMGWKRLARILPYCAEGVRSPPEADFFAVATFPRKIFGYQFPKPEVNVSIPVNGAYKSLIGTPSIEVDFYWKDAALVVEYNGLDTHDGGISPLDITQQTILKEHGIEVVFITKEQFGNAWLLDLIMRRLAEKIGIDPLEGWPQTSDVQELLDCLRKRDIHSTSPELREAQKRWIRLAE